MSTITRLFAALVAHHALLTAGLPAPEPLPAAVVAAAPPAQYTANPSIGSGTGSYKDSAHFRVYGVDSATADNTLKIMEAAHGCFVETLGWRSAGLSYKTAGAGGEEKGPWYKMNIFSVKDGSMPGAAAQTWNDANAGLPYLKVVDK